MRTKAEVREACERNAAEVRNLIGMAAWYDYAERVLRDGERAEVRAVWDAMSGRSCWNDAFLQWMRQAG